MTIQYIGNNREKLVDILLYMLFLVLNLYRCMCVFDRSVIELLSTTVENEEI